MRSGRVVCLLVVLGALVLARGVAGAATPTPGAPSPNATATLAATPTAFAVTVSYDATAVTWPVIPAAARLVIKGKLTATETAADGPCKPTVGNRVVTIDLDETLPGGATSWPLGVAALPAGEHWTVRAELIDFSAFDAEGNVIAGARLMQITEGCGFAVAPTPRVALPPTGAGGSAKGSRDLLPALILGLAAACGLGAGAASLSRGRARPPK